MEIDNCPKCGSTMPGLWINDITIDETTLYSVGCIICNWQGGIFNDKEEAIKNWNEWEEDNG